MEESVEFLVNVTILAEENDADNLAVLGLTIDEYITLLYPPPLPKVNGRWDKVIYGESVFK